MTFPIIFAVIEVSCKEHERLRPVGHIDRGLKDSPLFSLVSVWQPMIPRPADRKTRENHVTVFAAIKLNIVAKYHVHLRQSGQHRWLIDSIRSLDTLVHFLQSDNIRPDIVDNSSNSFQVEFPINPLSMMDVVREHAQAE